MFAPPRGDGEPPRPVGIDWPRAVAMAERAGLPWADVAELLPAIEDGVMGVAEES